MSNANPNGNRPGAPLVESRTPPWMGVWEYLSSAGLAEPVLRLGTHALLVASILLIAWGLRAYYSLAQTQLPSEKTGLATEALQAEIFTDQNPPQLPFFRPQTVLNPGIPRQAHLHTDVPSRPRLTVSTYVVQVGDTLIGIATRFGIKPQTLLWANQLVLGDNPHNLRPGQELQILPVDGTYHRWSAGDSLIAVANFFAVRPEDITNFPGNNLDPATIGDLEDPNISPGAWLIIPGGQRDFVSWSAPDIPRDNPGVAKVLGPGACETVAEGMLGSGVFSWPTENHFLSGFDYDPGINHFGIDIQGDEGDPVSAADSGVVVYAGWNNWGYGYMVVINHGNGWQTLYAHLNVIYVGCGQSVEQGALLGAIGGTGNATSAHLHFEMMYQGTKVNPQDFVG